MALPSNFCCTEENSISSLKIFHRHRPLDYLDMRLIFWEKTKKVPKVLWYFVALIECRNCVAISGRLEMIHKLCLEHNSFTKLWLGPAIMWILVNDPKSIQKILLSPLCLEKPFFYKFLRLENGLISAKCKVSINDIV